MKYDDLWYGDKPLNVEILLEHGDNDPCIIRTRAFHIGNQSEWGYISNLQDWAIKETARWRYTEPHWSDPVYYAA